jgi:hypothetical protein
MEHPVFGVDIKDRKYILQNYPKCFIGNHGYWLTLIFVGNEAVDWLVNSGGLLSRVEAVKLGQKLMDLQIIQHVAKQQPFADKNYFYEFVVNFQHCHILNISSQQLCRPCNRLWLLQRNSRGRYSILSKD